MKISVLKTVSAVLVLITIVVAQGPAKDQGSAANQSTTTSSGAGPTNSDLGHTAGIFNLDNKTPPAVDIMPPNSDHSYTMRNEGGKEYVRVTVNTPDYSEDTHSATKDDLIRMRQDIKQMAAEGIPQTTIKSLLVRLDNAVPGKAPYIDTAPANSEPEDDDY